MPSQFLIGTDPVTAAVKAMVQDTKTADVYISGPTIRVIMDAVFSTLSNEEAQCETHLILPALTGAEYLGSSFLYQLYRLASKIRISPQAVHCAVCSRKASVLISPGPSYKDPQLCALHVTDPDTVTQMYAYCEQLFQGGLSLRLSQE